MDFLETVKEELQRLPIGYLYQWASPDEIFEALEAAIVKAGQLHFGHSRQPSATYSEDCRQRRGLLRSRTRLRHSKLGTTSEQACEIDAALRELTLQLNRVRRAQVRARRALLVEEAEAAAVWEGRGGHARASGCCALSVRSEAT